MDRFTYKHLRLLFFVIFLPLYSYSQSITLVSPNGGEVWEANTTEDIVWTGTGIYGSIYIEYSLDAGQSWNYLYWGWGDDNGGSHAWDIPFIQSANVKIRVTYWDNQTVVDVSDNVFTINMPDFALVYPNGGETFYTGQVKNIQWIANATNQIMIEYSDDNGQTWNLVADNVQASLLNYNWTIPAVNSYNCLIKITDKDNLILNDSSNYNFSILPAPVINIIYPNGGEIIEVGDTVNIEWSGSGLGAGVIIEFSENNGQSWAYISSYSSSNPNGGTYQWIVPNIITNNALIRLKFWDYQAIQDQSDNIFSITLPSFALLYPNGGESFYPNDSVNIQWVASTSNTLFLEYSVDNGTNWNSIATNIDASNGNYTWAVPNTPSNQCLVRITDEDVPSKTDVSNQVFTINVLPQITLLNPNGGEVIEGGTNYTIEWTGSNITGNIYIEYSVNSGNSWNYVGWGWSNSTGGTYDWDVPNNYSINSLIRVKYWDYQQAFDVSDAVFSIVEPSFAVHTPNGGEVIYPGTQYDITWVAQNSSAIKIELSVNNGVNWSLVADNVNAQLNSYSWNVPVLPSQNCLIRITDVDNSIITDVSNNVFTISQLPSITLLYPNGGEVFTVGDVCQIQWEGLNLNGAVYIEASYNNGTSWNYVAWEWGSSNGGTFNWTIPNNVTNQALVRVKFWDYPAAFDVSNATFTIEPPDFAVISPQGNEQFYPTTQVQIQWYANNVSEIDIDYSIDDGISWLNIAQNFDASLGIYLWTVPNNPSSQCKIRLTQSNNPSEIVLSNVFTIKVLPIIEVVSPNGGEIVIAGSTYEIEWTGSNIDQGLNIEYSTNGGQSWNYINSAQGSPTGGSYLWQVPFVTSTSASVRLTLWNVNTVNDVSDNSFTIQMPPFVLIQPNGGQSFYPLQQVQIEWHAANSTYIKIEYSTDSGNNWILIEDSAVASFSAYTWTIPNTPSTNCLVRITDIDNPAYVEVSPSVFTIQPAPEIQLIKPNGGEVYTSGETVIIEWTGTNIEGNIYLEYSTNNGVSWQYLSWAWGNNNGGTYAWQVPYVSSNTVLVKIKFWSVPSVYDISNAVFSIQLPPFVLISPNTAENFYPGNTKNIQWNATNATYIRIDYTIDDGASWLLIFDSVTASANSYLWTIPNTPSTLCRVKITDIVNPTDFDISNEAFTIHPIPTLTIVYPNGGEVFTAGTTIDIEWIGTNINSSLYLEYSLNGGNTWQYLGWGYGDQTGGTYSWTVPFFESQNVKIRAKLWSLQSVNDISDAAFSIILPPFSLVSPNGGSNYYPGNSFNIEWIAQNSSKIKIQYTINNGLSWLLIADSVDAALNIYNWIIPNTPSNSCRVKITDINDTTVTDLSDNVFTIKVLPQITLLQPNGGEIWTAGDTTQIIWSGSNLDGNVVLEFTTNNWYTSTYIGGVWGQIHGASFPVTVPFVQTNTAKVRVRMLEAQTVSDQSDTTFRIVYPPFSLMTPNGGESYYPTNTVQIKWFASGINYVRIDYSTNNGSTWTNIEQSLNASNGIYNWIVPNTPSSQCLVRVSDVYDSLTFDLSNAVFTIKTLPHIQLVSPIGGEIIEAGSTYNIVWTGSNLEQSVRLYYSVDLGYSWIFIDEVWDMFNGHTYQWLVPYNVTNNALVKVFLFNAPAVASQSNSVFSIINPQISVITPNQTETLFPFNEKIIKWVTTDSINVDIDYTIDNENTWINIVSGLSSSLGEYQWIVPNTPSDSCKIRISNSNNPQFNDKSDSLFIINALPQLSLIYPNGGEVLIGGTIASVLWEGQNLTGPVIIELTTDNWATSQLLDWKEGNTTGDSISWIVPFVPTNNAKIKAYYYQAPVIEDMSDDFFTIVNPPFALVNPLGGETFYPSNEVYIQWIADNATSIKIEYSTDNGNTWFLITSNVNTTQGFYPWIVPNTPSDKCLVKITDEFNSQNTSQSIHTFTIYPYPTLTLDYPNGNEVFVAGNTYPIEWSGTNLNGGISLEYSVDGGLSWQFIANQFNMSFGSVYYWQVPFQLTTQAKVRVSFLPISQMYDESNNVFSIVEPSFALVAPNNPGLQFYPLSQMNIQWVATASTFIKILFSTDNGQTWTLIEDSVDASLGNYLWTIPNMPSSICKIRIIDVDDPLIYDTSDNTFTIQFLPQLTLINPIGGEQYKTGDAIQIVWSGAYLTGGLNITYSIDTGQTWQNITTKWGNPNGDHFIWIAPQIQANVLLKITYIDISSISAQTDTFFTICFDPQLYIISSPEVCQPNTVDISQYFADSLNAYGNVSYWLDSNATQPLSNPFDVSLSGIYYILKQTFIGGCSYLKPIEVSVGTTPAPPQINANHHLCSADTMNLISASGQNIQWFADDLLTILIDTGNVINIAQFISDTIIYITQYNTPSCPSLPTETQINYYITPQPPVVSPQPSYCEGDSVNDIVAQGNNISWYSDISLNNIVSIGNTLSLNPLSADTNFFVIQTENNCPSAPQIVSLNVYPIPPKPTISLVGTEIISSAPIGNLWYNIQGVLQDTSQNYQPPIEGFYYVVVNINGCLSDTSDIIYYYFTENHLVQVLKDKLYVYPNPFNDSFNVVFINNKEAEFKCDIYDLTGSLIYSEQFMFSPFNVEYIIAPGELLPGIYFIRMMSLNDTFYEKIIKH